MREVKFWAEERVEVLDTGDTYRVQHIEMEVSSTSDIDLHSWPCLEMDPIVPRMRPGGIHIRS